MRSTIFGRSPLGLSLVWFVASTVIFVVAMNHRPTLMVFVWRWVFGALSAFGACDLAVRINRYRW